MSGEELAREDVEPPGAGGSSGVVPDILVELCGVLEQRGRVGEGRCGGEDEEDNSPPNRLSFLPSRMSLWSYRHRGS